MATKKKGAPIFGLIIVGIFIIFVGTCIFGDKDKTPQEQEAKKKAIIDSVVNSNEQNMASQAREDSIAFEAMKKSNPKAYKLHKSHLDWSADDCESVAKNLIWIGMQYEMVVSERGKPNHISTSNYGNGNEYQACWDDYHTSCFYFGEDHIITSYN